MSTPENQRVDRKSLRLVTGKRADLHELACSCVCFANAAGGTLLIGIEDDEDHPPAGQRIEPLLLEKLRKRIGELTVNVQVIPRLCRDANGGEYIEVQVPRSAGVASTSDGRWDDFSGDTEGKNGAEIERF